MLARSMPQVQGSKLVDDFEIHETLAGLLSVPRRCLNFTTLFSPRDHTWSDVSAFHRKCDGKGPTFVVLRSSDGFMYGEYTSASWTSCPGYQADPEAFLFRLSPASTPHKKQHMRTEKFQVSATRVRVDCALLCSTRDGPRFGGGRDLYML